MTGARAFGAESVKGLDPVEWVLAMHADPTRWKDEKVVRVTHVGLRDAAKLPAGQDHFSFNELTTHPGLRAAIGAVADKQHKDSEAKLDPIEREISDLSETIGIMDGVFTGDALRVIPHPTDAAATWATLADLQTVDSGPLSRVRSLHDALVAAAKAGDAAGVGSAASALARRLAELSPSAYPAAEDIGVEVRYNRLKPFRLAWLFYLLGLATLVASFAMPRRPLIIGGFAGILIGFAIHAYGMYLRMLISGRPPVTNMYESVIFVAWGAVLFALIFEAVYRARWFATTAAAVAVLSLLVADTVPILNGSIEPLVPVLRDNMWLTVHVLTITLSYAAFFLAMALGHVNLGLYFFAPNRRDLLTELSRFLYRALQVGTLLCALGTALGGWWASYSWGRFWGWDAKETSIFVALMFYLAVMHSRLVGLVRDFGTAVASIVGFLLVLWAWYGVNFVLGVGLHSYGFGSGGYTWVGGYVGLEMLIIGAAMVRYRQSQAAPAPAPALQPAPQA